MDNIIEQIENFASLEARQRQIYAQQFDREFRAINPPPVLVQPSIWDEGEDIVLHAVTIVANFLLTAIGSFSVFSAIEAKALMAEGRPSEFLAILFGITAFVALDLSLVAGGFRDGKIAAKSQGKYEKIGGYVYALVFAAMTLVAAYRSIVAFGAAVIGEQAVAWLQIIISFIVTTIPILTMKPLSFALGFVFGSIEPRRKAAEQEWRQQMKNWQEEYQRRLDEYLSGRIKGQNALLRLHQRQAESAASSIDGKKPVKPQSEIFAETLAEFGGDPNNLPPDFRRIAIERGISPGNLRVYLARARQKTS